jgi:hypothetical protein
MTKPRMTTNGKLCGSCSRHCPGRSRITLGKGHLLPGYSDHMSPDKCSTSRLAQHQVRRLFRTYHVVSGVEHEGYSESGCAIDGDILIDGRRYTLAPNQ